jgi:zinc transporter
METAEGEYGSDRKGLVWAFRFGADGGGTPFDPGEQEILHGGSFDWLHASLSNRAAESWMRESLGLPEAFFGAMRDGISSTRIEQDDDSLVAVLHDMNFDFQFDPQAVSTAVVCVRPDLLLTARLHPLRSLDRLRERVRAGERFLTSAHLLARLLTDQAESLAGISRQATTEVDRIEDGILGTALVRSREELASLRRVLVRIQRLLAPEPSAFFRLLNRPPTWMESDVVQELRQAAEEFSAAVADCAALAERIRLLQEEVAARMNERLNRTLFVLTVVTVLALPVNMAAGLFGMNVGGIPFSESRHGFWVVGTLLALVTVFLGWLSLRRRWY